MASTIPTKFLIISDTHDFKFGDAEEVDGKFRLPVPKADVLLHCGDLTKIGGVVAPTQRPLEMLRAIDAELKLVIAGDHDINLDGDHFANRNKDEKVGIMKDQLAKEAGVTYLTEGLYTFTLKSGVQFKIFTSPYTPNLFDYAFTYERDKDRFNPTKQVAPGTKSTGLHLIPNHPLVDIIMTHGPPQNILDNDVGCEALLHAVSRAKPLLHCFGHIHEGYGAEVVTWKNCKKIGRFPIGAEAIESRESVSSKNNYPHPSKISLTFGEHTLMVNAAIMNSNFKPTNAPWFVELDLPRGTLEQL